MIDLTRLGGEVFYLNCRLIETVEQIPETKIVLTNGHYYLVRESVEALLRKIDDYYSAQRGQ